MELPPSCYRISAKALVWDETRTKFLLLQEDNGHWDLPGGGIQWNETPIECLTREIKEEMGVDVESINTKPVLFYTLTNPTVKYANVVYETVLKSLDFVPSDECQTMQFVSPDEARALPVRPNVLMFLENLSREK